MTGRGCGSYGRAMTFLWFIVWLVANNVGGHAPLRGRA
jgi:hypothetical protein